MGLYSQWTELAKAERSPEQSRVFWNDYFEKEKNVYRYILSNNAARLEGKVRDLAGKFGMEPVIFAGFLDGINTSLVNALDLDSLEEDTEIVADIDFEKLYRNMLEAKADWLYRLKEWDGILDRNRRNKIMQEYRLSKMAVSNKVGRNEPCPCGSGKKYKKCCGA